MPRPVVLTIAGSDSGGGAGIQADLRAIAAHGGFGTSVVTCVTAQNLETVSAVQALDPPMIESQLEAVLAGFPVRAAKTGMLFSRKIVEVVARVAAREDFPPLVVDPVMVATSGSRLLKPEAEEAYRSLLFPHAAVITPNMDEAGVLLRRPLREESDLAAGAEELGRRYHTAVFLKGGHLPGAPVDFLWLKGTLYRWEGERIEGVNTHGSGCILAAAIASRLARGEDVVGACEGARGFLLESFRNPVTLEDGTVLLGLPGSGVPPADSVRVVVVASHRPPSGRVLVAAAGERLPFQRRLTEWEGWLWCTREDTSAWVPENWVAIKGTECTLLRDYDSTELTTREGELLSIVVTESGWGWVRNEAGLEGWVPLRSLRFALGETVPARTRPEDTI